MPKSPTTSYVESAAAATGDYVTRRIEGVGWVRVGFVSESRSKRTRHQHSIRSETMSSSKLIRGLCAIMAVQASRSAPASWSTTEAS